MNAVHSSRRSNPRSIPQETHAFHTKGLCSLSNTYSVESRKLTTHRPPVSSSLVLAVSVCVCVLTNDVFEMKMSSGSQQQSANARMHFGSMMRHRNFIGSYRRLVGRTTALRTGLHSRASVEHVRGAQCSLFHSSRLFPVKIQIQQLKHKKYEYTFCAVTVLRLLLCVTLQFQWPFVPEVQRKVLVAAREEQAPSSNPRQHCWTTAGPPPLTGSATQPPTPTVKLQTTFERGLLITTQSRKIFSLEATLLSTTSP